MDRGILRLGARSLDDEVDVYNRFVSTCFRHHVERRFGGPSKLVSLMSNREPFELLHP